MNKVLQDAKALKNKASTSSSPASALHAPKSSIADNAIGASSSQLNSSSAGLGCINYDASTRTITVSCSSARLTDIDNKLHDIAF